MLCINTFWRVMYFPDQAKKKIKIAATINLKDAKHVIAGNVNFYSQNNDVYLIVMIKSVLSIFTRTPHVCGWEERESLAPSE